MLWVTRGVNQVEKLMQPSYLLTKNAVHKRVTQFPPGVLYRQWKKYHYSHRATFGLSVAFAT